MMDILTDYANWKFENYTLIDTLSKNGSAIIRRFPHVLAVCDFFYNEVTNNHYKMSQDEEIIFESGFNYLHDHFNTIDLILKHDFNSSFTEMEKCSKTINLLLYINDFQAELENVAPQNISGMKTLDDLEQRTMKFIETHTNAPDTMFQLLSDVTSDMFKDGYQGVNEIMYEVADELGITPDESDDDTYEI